MEKRIPVINNTSMSIYVGSNIVPPGETRDFPESQVPMHLRLADAESNPAETEANIQPEDPLVELLRHKIADVEAALPGLSDTDLERLGELEQLNDNPRKGVLSAIGEEILKRAEAKGNA